MKRRMRLTVTTPLELIVQLDDVVSVRAEDASGGFGILPGRADLLTASDAMVLRWRRVPGRWHFAAMRGAILRVSGGDAVEVAARDAIVSDDLADLEGRVAARKAAALEAARRARTGQMRLHARAIREIMRRIAPRPPDVTAVAEEPG